MKKRILLLTTGGTIASLPTDRGLSPGLNGTALAGLLPQGVLEHSCIWIPPTSSRRSGRPLHGMSMKTERNMMAL